MTEQKNDIKLMDIALPPTEAWHSKTPSGKRAKAHGGKFLKGPIPLPWLIAAGTLPGKALVVGVGLWYLSGVTGAKVVKPTGELWKALHISRQAAYRALAGLETTGLIDVERHCGRAPIVRIRIVKYP